MTAQEFCSYTLPLAAAAQVKYGVNAIGAMAQSAIETGWGQYAPGNMFFGVKATASWTGLTQQLLTTEYVDGEYKQQYSTFRAYATPVESFYDYGALISGLSRYANAMNYPGYNQTSEYISAVATGGYSTSPTYATTVNSIVTTIKKYVSEADLNAELKKKV